MKGVENVFKEYSNYYDLFYEHKNYLQESRFFIDRLQSLNPKAKHLIELGSGTGNYTCYFCNSGYHVTGIEKSSEMIEKSKSKCIPNFKPIQADIVSFSLPKKFDAAYSLFDVMCYITKTNDIIACLKNIANHLNTSGVLIFDSWYTPAVYSAMPKPVTKHVENDVYDIIRHSKPVINYQQNIVDVAYEFIVKNKLTNQQHTINETHSLRHFGIPEIELFASLSGFELVRCCELLTLKPASKDSWKVYYQLQKK